MTMAVKKFGLSVSENTYLEAQKIVESGAYRNMSHLFEEGARRIIREEAAKASGRSLPNENAPPPWPYTGRLPGGA